MRLLIIDDDEDFRRLLAQYIVREWPDAQVDGYDPLERDMPDGAFPLGAYDAVILDYMLGRDDGLNWLVHLKGRRDCPPVLFLTGAGNEIIAVRAMKAGADDYQRKQELTQDRLVCAIHELLQESTEGTLSPQLASRMEAHVLGLRIRIPGISILRLIGEGGMSRVYLGSREGDDEPLVVKVLRREVMKERNALARFMEEYELVERIQSRHIARVYSHGITDGYAHLVTEFFDGGDLSKRLGDKPFEPKEALRLFRELMFALGDIHEAGILHRDLKPQNLMFRSDGSLAIVDFGIAKHVDAIDRTGHGEILGSPRYMSPEQVQGRVLDRRTDVYSAGVLLYQMLTGSHLFAGESAVEVALHHLNTPPPALPQPLAKYQRLMDKLVEKDREARFRNADEVLGYLLRNLCQDSGARKAGVTLPLR
jgi:eukaryotic-like serine/threonine-protein kinase